MNQVFNLFTRQLATACQFAQDFFAILTRFDNHLATLLLRKFNLCFNVCNRIVSLTRRFNFGFLANSCGIGTGFAH